MAQANVAHTVAGGSGRVCSVLPTHVLGKIQELRISIHKLLQPFNIAMMSECVILYFMKYQSASDWKF